jgi:exodeoxyribonuclease V beta subunit
MTATHSPPTFSLTGPLPTGTTAIEASAGTGKTYAIVSLATRFVAEQGMPLSQLMLVTFGRAATQELLDRARKRFIGCAAALADPAAARESHDRVIAHLAAADDAEVRQRRRRLLRALSDFDAATIVTTHSFCQRMLDGVGVAGDYEPAATLRENLAELVDEVSDDLYVARFSDVLQPPMTVRDARAVATAATGDPQAGLVPTDAAADSAAGRRVSFASAARAELVRRKRMRGVRDYNDQLVLLADALADPDFGPVAAARIRSRYRVVLVDEFQDTDPLQWEILRVAFHGFVTLVLVGDPKQAIYSFRGADVLTYLDAVRVADHRAELGTNWRSDAGLVRALHHLYGGVALGHDDIVAHPVTAAHEPSRVPGGAPLRLRHLDRAAFGSPDLAYVGVARPHIARDVAADVVATLSSGQQIVEEGGPRPLRSSDIAVLVRSRDQGSLVCEALDRAGVPCVLAGGSSVFTTVAATAWQRMLAALEQPQRPERVRLAALSPLLSYAADELAVGGAALVAALSAQMRQWAAVFDGCGPLAMFELIAASRGLEARLVGVAGGERTLTDLRHVAQLMNRAVADEQLGLVSLSSWLAQRIADEQYTPVSDRGRLLDRESAAVRVVTIHASKGLEFPIVYLPFCWDETKPQKPVALLLHQDGRRVRDVGGDTGPGYRQRLGEHEAEEAGEELRLLYVAATRAQSRVVAWWAPTRKTSGAPLHRLVFGRGRGEVQPAEHAAVPADRVLAQRFSAWAAPAADVVEVEAAPGLDGVAGAVLPPQGDGVGELAVASFSRALDWSWQRSSYSRLTAGSHEAVAESFSETEESGTVDEPGGPAPAGAAFVGDAPSLMNDLPAGTAFGTLVHVVLEKVDTSAGDLAAEVRGRVEEVAASRLSPVDVGALATALTAVLRTPIPGGTLASVVPADRLTELEFEFPLAGGDLAVAGAATVGAIAEVMERHLSDADPLAGYPARLRMVPDVTLRGYMAGSIDAVLRFAGPRYVVVDYKTNKLFAGPVDAVQFSQEAMAAEMLRQHYPLQALLYSVALHRYLRWRQPGYSPSEHLGGVLYLFVRAMVGERTPPGCGVFSWHPPAELVMALSDLLAGR